VSIASKGSVQRLHNYSDLLNTEGVVVPKQRSKFRKRLVDSSKHYFFSNKLPADCRQELEAQAPGSFIICPSERSSSELLLLLKVDQGSILEKQVVEFERNEMQAASMKG